MKLTPSALTVSLLVAFPILFITVALCYIYWKTVNYGVDFLHALWIIVPCFFFSVYKYIRGKNIAYVVASSLNLLAVIFFVSVNKFNVMINYDEWAGRGMPGAFEKSMSPITDSNRKPTFTKEEVAEINKESEKALEESASDMPTFKLNPDLEN